MNVLKKCAYRTMSENRRRTVVTIIGVVISTALIMTTATLFASGRTSLREMSRRADGDYHYFFEEVRREDLNYFTYNQNVESCGLISDLECARYPDFKASVNGVKKEFLFVRAFWNEDAMQRLSLNLKRGRLPETDTELLLSYNLWENPNVRWKIGDEITLTFGQRCIGDTILEFEAPVSEEESLEGGVQKTYTVVGIAAYTPESGKEYSRAVPGYYAYTRKEGELPERLDVYAKYTKWGLKHHEQVTAGILGISEELFGRYFFTKEMDGRTVFSNGAGAENCTPQEIAQAGKLTGYLDRQTGLVETYLFRLSDIRDPYVYQSLGLAEIVILLIVLTSVFSIRNSFAISLAEKSRMYGRLSGVGMTRRQLRSMVYHEAFFVGIVGIPIGILTGTLGTALFLKLFGKFMLLGYDTYFVFDFSWAALAVCLVQAVLTVYLSAMESAHLASKIPPIEAIRGNRMIRMKKNSLKSPKWVKRLFGAGGVLAYKNLRRSKDKYRTMVLSIVGAVAVFIGLSSFVQYSQLHKEEILPNLGHLSISPNNDRGNALLREIVRKEGVTRWQLTRLGLITIKTEDVPFSAEGLARLEWLRERHRDWDKEYLPVVTLGEEEYARFCREAGTTAEKAKDKLIIVGLGEYIDSGMSAKDTKVWKEIVDFRPGMRITGQAAGYDPEVTKDMDRETYKEYQENREQITFEVLCQTRKKPMVSTQARYYAVASEEWMDAHPDVLQSSSDYLYLYCESPDDMEKELQSLYGDELNISNDYRYYQEARGEYLTVEIVLFGFIGMISLVGVTNVFNTITANMELRAPEFAILSSMGMTEKEFKRMIFLEGVFYGGKAFLIAVCLGTAISYGLYVVMEPLKIRRFYPPFLAIWLSALALFLLLYGIMRYSMKKVQKRNIIETIRSENI